MPRLSQEVQASLLGINFTMDQSVTGDNGGVGTPTVTAAQAGTLTTRTDANTGSITATVGTGHGITAGQKLDVYWEGGVQRNCTVGTIAGAVIPIDLGVGDDLPALNTAVTIKVPQTEAHVFDGDECLGFGVTSPDYPAVVVYRQADGTEIFAVVLDTGESYSWSSNSAVTNPLAGQNVGLISFSHGSTEGSSVLSTAYVRT